MKESMINEAENMFLNILKAQPGFLKEMYPAKDEGKGLADFIDSFTRKYSANREALLK